MDALRLLSRSTKRIRREDASAGVNKSLGDTSVVDQSFSHNDTNEKKRKREDDHSDLPNFFGKKVVAGSRKGMTSTKRDVPDSEDGDLEGDNKPMQKNASVAMSEEKAKQILKENKLKVTWLNSSACRSQRTKDKTPKSTAKSNIQIFPHPLQSFSSLSDFDIPKNIIGNVVEQGFDTPTEVQMASLPLLLTSCASYLPSLDDASLTEVDLLTVAPTGSGKTLAFLLPLLRNVYVHKKQDNEKRKHSVAVILAPTKELVAQIVNEARKLAQNTGVQITQTRRGMRLPGSLPLEDNLEVDSAVATVVKADVLVSTPGLLHSMLEDVNPESKQVALQHVRYFVLDEADVLLDPLFREQTLSVWNALVHPNLRVGLWSATMGSSIEELARTVIDERSKRLTEIASISTSFRIAPLIRVVVGLKDSAIPNVEHRLVYAATEQGKLLGLRQVLHPTSSKAESQAPLIPPFLVFTQTIERAVALHSELLYDIPIEAGGAGRIAVLHADLSDTARENVMKSFRKGEIWVLITTDLLSRGIDFRGVNGVVNYDMPTSSAAYVHRVGRTGRAGHQGGIAITFYSKEDIAYMRNIVNVVSAAQKQRPGHKSDDGGVEQWLLDALPTLTKNDKQRLKKRGVESRTAHGQTKSGKPNTKTQISTKAGFQRRMENKKKGAIKGSQRRKEDAQSASDSEGGSSFGGFD